MPPITQALCGVVLVVTPQKELSQTLELALALRGHSVTWCPDAVHALNYSAHQDFDLIVVDLCLLDVGSLDLVGEIKARGRKEEVLIASFNETQPDEYSESQLAELGLVDPFKVDKLIGTVENALQRRHQAIGLGSARSGITDALGNTNGQSKPSQKSKLPNSTALIGCSPLMKQLFRTIARIAPRESNVLITGATGTGKELVARAIHDRSSRSDGPFVDVNSSAIPDTLFETEFFGHQRGTFTGAYETRRGLFERASGGTLFLDEVDTLNLAAQAKLLRVLQERHLRRLGGRENISIDVRIIAATSSNLKAATTNGAFRPDLYFRLRVMPLHVPRLRERVEDIELLVDHFLSSQGERNGKQQRRFSPEAMRALTNYGWPGNVRELENAIEYALAIGNDEELGIDDLPPDMFGEDMDSMDEFKVPGLQNDASLAEVERRHILTVFDRCGRHHNKTAAALRIDRRTLYRKLQQYNLELEIKSA